MLILFSDRKLESDLRDGFVSGEALPAEHNGDIWSREATKHGAILTGKNQRFLLGVSIRQVTRFDCICKRKRIQ